MTIAQGSDGFTRGEPFIWTNADANANWGSRGRKPKCGFCLRVFVVGDVVRWLYCHEGPNIFVCADDDSPDAAMRFDERWRTVISPILREWGGYYS